MSIYKKYLYTLAIANDMLYCPTKQFQFDKVLETDKSNPDRPSATIYSELIAISSKNSITACLCLIFVSKLFSRLVIDEIEQ